MGYNSEIIADGEVDYTSERYTQLKDINGQFNTKLKKTFAEWNVPAS